MRRIIALATVLGLVVSVILAVTSVTLANASAPPDNDGEPCVPEPAHSADWTNNGEQVRTETEVAPGPDTDTERWVFISETAPEVITPATEGKHYSLKGNSGIGADEIPSPPPADYWQANTSQEPHDNGSGTPVTWLNGVGSGLHYASHRSEGLRDWFYYEPGTTAVTDTDFLWQKQVRAWIPATECPPGDVQIPTPVLISGQDPCGTANDVPDQVADGDHYTVAVDGLTITVTADAGFYFLGEDGETRLPSVQFVADELTNEPCPPSVEIVPFAVPGEPTPPTCEAAGSYSLPDRTPNVDFAIDRPVNAPGTYTVTATLVNPGATTWPDGTTAPLRFTITVTGALGVQSTNPGALCFVAPPPDCVNSPSQETCPEPPGTRSEEITKECVNGDLVTTHSESGTNPVWNEETLQWDLVPFVGSSQTVKEDATTCATPPLGPDGPDGPDSTDGPDGSDGSDGADGPDTLGSPNVPTVIDAGLTSVGPESESSVNFGLLAGVMVALVFSMLGVATLVRGTGTKK